MTPADPSPSALAALKARPRPLRLEPRVQAYAWGDASFIPRLTGVAPSGAPQAELWVGAHPALPAAARLGDDAVPLDRLIAADPDAFLGRAVARRFGGRLPFLLKVLAAARPLSIQAHPDKARAEAGFAARVYPDDNHKPELLAALTPFHALRGFRPPAEIAEELRRAPELASLADGFTAGEGGLRRLYTDVMTCPQDRVDRLLSPLLRRLAEENARSPFAETDRRYWALRADALFSMEGRRDRGILSIFLLNLVRLSPGEAIHAPAGVLHAYLAGAGVEVMASSDNVVRGGLTAKSVDVRELLAILSFAGGPPEVLSPRQAGPGVLVYPAPDPDFALAVLSPGPDAPVDVPAGPCAGIVIEAGAPVHLEGGGETLVLKKGEAFFIPAGAPHRLSSEAPAAVYRVSVPQFLENQADKG